MTLNQKIKQMARQAKRAGWSRDKAREAAPNAKPEYVETFMTEFDRYQPQKK